MSTLYVNVARFARNVSNETFSVIFKHRLERQTLKLKRRRGRRKVHFQSIKREEIIWKASFLAFLSKAKFAVACTLSEKYNLCPKKNIFTKLTQIDSIWSNLTFKYQCDWFWLILTDFDRFGLIWTDLDWLGLIWRLIWTH